MGVLVICTQNEVFLNLTEVFLILTEGFPCFFLSCKANARVNLAKTGHGPHSTTLVVICVVRLLFVLFYVLFVCKCVLTPGDNPTAVNKYIIIRYEALFGILFKIIRRIRKTGNKRQLASSCPHGNTRLLLDGFS